MSRRGVLTAFGFLGVVAVISALIVGLASTADIEAAPRGGRVQGATPAPCGAAGDLDADLGRNVAAESRCFELRLYTVRDGVDGAEGGINELHQRFREKEVELFQKHGAEIIAVWQDLGEPRRLIWMLAYRDRAHRDEVFAAFVADPEWSELLQRLNPPMERSTVYMMSATDYSPLK